MSKTFSAIFRDIAQVFFASAVVTPIIAVGVEKNWPVIVVGLGAALAFWWLAVKMGRREKL